MGKPRIARSLFVILLSFQFTFYFSPPAAAAVGTSGTVHPSNGMGVLDMTGAMQVKDPFGACHADSYSVMEELGVKMNRKDISWSGIEVGDDNWNWAAWDARIASLKAKNMTVLPILDYGNLAVQTGTTHGSRIYTEADINEWLEYVNECVERYYVNDSSFVTDWEIWNEANLGEFNASTGFWTGTDDEFFELQKRTAANLSLQYPGLNILSNGISGHSPAYLDAMFEHGAMENIDTLAFHPYSGSNYDTLPVKINEVKEVCEKHDFNGDIWITEVGMSTQFDPGEVGFEEDYKRVLDLQATLVPKVYAHSIANGIDVITWYCLGDGPDYTWGEHNFGLVYYSANTYKPGPYINDTLKPAGYAYKALAHNLNWSTYVPNAITVKPPLPSTSKLESFYFLKANGDVTIIMWNTNDDHLAVSFDVLSSGFEVYGPPSYKLGECDGITNRSAGNVTTISLDLNIEPVIFVIDTPDGLNATSITIQGSITFFDVAMVMIIPTLVGFCVVIGFRKVFKFKTGHAS
ncbi:MAG: hypothetical protein ACTSUE_10705 [Promethearchaeota archaeon]